MIICLKQALKMFAGYPMHCTMKWKIKMSITLFEDGIFFPFEKFQILDFVCMYISYYMTDTVSVLTRTTKKMFNSKMMEMMKYKLI